MGANYSFSDSIEKQIIFFFKENSLFDQASIRTNCIDYLNQFNYNKNKHRHILLKLNCKKNYELPIAMNRSLRGLTSEKIRSIYLKTAANTSS